MEISRKDICRLEATLKLSEKSTFMIHRMAAIVYKGKVLSYGINRESPGWLKNPLYKNKAIHCELDAVLNIPRHIFKGATIFVAGKTRSGNLITSKPCQACQILLFNLGFKKAVYYNKDGTIGILEF